VAAPDTDRAIRITRLGGSPTEEQTCLAPGRMAPEGGGDRRASHGRNRSAKFRGTCSHFPQRSLWLLNSARICADERVVDLGRRNLLFAWRL